MKQRGEHEGKRTERKSSQQESLVLTLLKVLPLGAHYSLYTLGAPWCLDLCSAVRRVMNEASQQMVPRSERDEGSISVQPGVWERAADPWKERWLTAGNLWTIITVPIAQLVKNLPAVQETLVQFLGQEYPLEKG